jgi:hypothetical protein
MLTTNNKENRLIWGYTDQKSQYILTRTFTMLCVVSGMNS